MQILIGRPSSVFSKHLIISSHRPPWRKVSILHASSSSSFKTEEEEDEDYSNQSRGSLPRFYSQVLPHCKGDVVRVDGDEFRHMTKVLRLTLHDNDGFLRVKLFWGDSGEELNALKGNANARVELFNGKGGITEGCIHNIDRTGLDFMALEDPKVVISKSTHWHVFAAFGTLKGSRADWLVEKCAELGASSVTPLLTERSPSISANRVDRLQRVNFAAAKQCQRLHQMTLNPPTKVVSLLPTVSQCKLSFLAVAEATPLISTLAFKRKEASGIVIVGPEGDFTDKEVKMMREAGATAVGLGAHRLRVETATMALLATLMFWSDSQEEESAVGGGGGYGTS